MSSVVIWEDPETGIYVEWNKQAPHSVTVPIQINDEGWLLQHCHRKEYYGEKSAIRAAKRMVKERREELEAMESQYKRYRIEWKSGYGEVAPVVCDRTYFDNSVRGFDDAFRAEVDKLKYPGAEYEYIVGHSGEHVVVKRLK